MSISDNSKLYNEYDRILSAIYVNLFSFSKKDKIIRIIGFDPKDKSSLCVYEMARTVSQLEHMPIYLDVSFFQWIFLRFHKKFRHIHRLTPRQIKNLLNRTDINERTYFDVKTDLAYVTQFYEIAKSNSNIFNDIYGAFYENH